MLHSFQLTSENKYKLKGVGSGDLLFFTIKYYIFVVKTDLFVFDLLCACLLYFHSESRTKLCTYVRDKHLFFLLRACLIRISQKKSLFNMTKHFTLRISLDLL